jgi:hypothetical protein
MSLGGGGGGSAPDPQVGRAALENAQLGREYLGFMRQQSDITNRWAGEDRGRAQSVFQPLQDNFIAEAQAYDTPQRREAAAREAGADVTQAFGLARGQRQRTNMAMGVDPASGRAQETGLRDSNAEALAVAGAKNISRRQTEATGRQLRGAAIDMGAGLGVNPATSMGLSSNAVASGFQGAMQGNQSVMQAGMHNDQVNAQRYSNRMNLLGSTLGGVGMLAGAFISSKKAKTDKRKPSMSALDAMKKMPVEEWRYKDGVGDGGAQRHVGPYAEDFHRATGKGDGQTIPVQDAIGITMGAVQELSKKVDQIGKRAGG